MPDRQMLGGGPLWVLRWTLAGLPHYGRLFETNSAQIHLQIVGGP
jgi:hypothetical protein